MEPTHTPVGADASRAIEVLQHEIQQLRAALDTLPAFVIVMTLDDRVEYVNRAYREYTGLTVETVMERWTSIVHPEDLEPFLRSWHTSRASGAPSERAVRLLRVDGQYRWFLIRARPLMDADGRIAKWASVSTDIEEQIQSEARIRQDERELRLLVDSLPQKIAAIHTDGRVFFLNQAGLEYLGRRIEDLVEASDQFGGVYFHEDLEAARAAVTQALADGAACEFEARLLRFDGEPRWHLIRYQPVHDDSGRVVRWYGSAVDIHRRKESEDRIRTENLVLREELHDATMSGAVVGSSAAIRSVLASVSKVAPTDSTVLLTGETGTGKELIARAIHDRSRRRAGPFVAVNCAAIPPSLLASELFGHEKGAFTGAVQRRAGRFERADGGTLFLDEIGELPAETQVALLRVLQEREFERVGGTRSLSVNVRVIAATNRDLNAAVLDGRFRADLFYRLNVFPVHMPALRERRDDTPLLVQHFVARCARMIGKKIRGIDRESLERLRAHDWPGNVRELQNIIERAVIVTDTDTLTIDPSWLQRHAPSPVASRVLPLMDQLAAAERALIESTLQATRGKISGPFGAAMRLGLAATTLESRIKALNIDKRRFKAPD